MQTNQNYEQFGTEDNAYHYKNKQFGTDNYQNNNKNTYKIF